MKLTPSRQEAMRMLRARKGRVNNDALGGNKRDQPGPCRKDDNKAVVLPAEDSRTRCRLAVAGKVATLKSALQIRFLVSGNGKTLSSVRFEGALDRRVEASILGKIVWDAGCWMLVMVGDVMSC